MRCAYFEFVLFVFTYCSTLGAGGVFTPFWDGKAVAGGMKSFSFLSNFLTCSATVAVGILRGGVDMFGGLKTPIASGVGTQFLFQYYHQLDLLELS